MRQDLKELKVEVVEKLKKSKSSSNILVCSIEKNICFSTSALESYCLSNWQPIIYDLLLMAAVVEFCDRSLRRYSLIWGRKFCVRVPVHDARKWQSENVSRSLEAALETLTGDSWSFEFRNREELFPYPRQQALNLSENAKSVMTFSNGMDSLAVAGIMKAKQGETFIPVRVASKQTNTKANIPFTAIPFQVKIERGREVSQFARGFKFSLIGAVAAYLSNTSEVIVAESGQAIFAPVLSVVGHAYPDYRTHPKFTKKMEQFIVAILGREISYKFERIWSTKGETLKEYVSLFPGKNDWIGTMSCWRSSRQVGTRQCGICAACILRRLSVHAAGLSEPSERYVWENLSASTFEAGIYESFRGTKRYRRFGKSHRDYAIAGVRLFDFLAMYLHDPENQQTIHDHSLQLEKILGIAHGKIENDLRNLLSKHEREWKKFLLALGPDSFIYQWIRTPP